jgi:hypothetical protein
MSTPESFEHRELRELLGAYALGGLPDEERARAQVHLDGCPACRAELAELVPVVEALQTVDPEALLTAPAPPPDLGARIAAAIAEERLLVQARARREAAMHSRRRILTAVAATVVVVVALGGGVVVGRSTAPPLAAGPTGAPIPMEEISLRALDPAIDVESAVLIPHTWGVEARFVASGLPAGATFHAAFRSTDGRMLPAGEFIGTGDSTLKCNMQSALLRHDTTAFVVTDGDGREVLVADL